MKYSIYIDESGDFSEGLLKYAGSGKAKNRKASIVGGLCSSLREKEWKERFKSLTKSLNERLGTELKYPAHFHCSDLIRGKIKISTLFSLDNNVECAETVFDTTVGAVRESSGFIFAAKNRGKNFEWSSQATYGVILVSALRSAIEHLAQSGGTVDELEIVVAQRSFGETAVKNYNYALPKFVEEQILAGGTDGVRLARDLKGRGKLIIKMGVATRNPGLIAADFVCSFLRAGNTRSSEPLISSPELVSFGDYRKFYEEEKLRLIKYGQYAAVVEFLRKFIPDREGKPDLTSLISALRRESNPDVLARELPALIAETAYLIRIRTEEEQALGIARTILEELIRIAENKLTAAGDPRSQKQWADVLVDAMVYLSTCYNHTGAVEPQKAIDAKISEVLEKYGRLMSRSYREREELLLEARTRNLNILFNDYLFMDIIKQFTGEVDQREKDIPPGQADELLGQMLGSIGQACAFQARIEPEVWSDMARDYLTQSLKHFEPGTLFYAMSVNFLATLAWQENDTAMACREMNRHPQAPGVQNPDDLLNNLAGYLTGDGLSVFDCVNYLRIAAAEVENGGTLNIKNLNDISKFWNSRIREEHPFEHLLKWIGYLYFLSDDAKTAVETYLSAVRICDKLNFTVKTIGLSILGLQAVTLRESGQVHEYGKCLADLRLKSDKLCQESAGFADYLTSFGGTEGLIAMVKKHGPEGASEVARFLPFNYS